MPSEEVLTCRSVTWSVPDMLISQSLICSAAVKAIPLGTGEIYWDTGTSGGKARRFWSQASNIVVIIPQPCMAKRQGIPKIFREQKDLSGGCKTIYPSSVMANSNAHMSLSLLEAIPHIHDASAND